MHHAVKWSAKYETGVYRIDEQNRQIFHILRDLDAALAARSAEQIQDVVIDLLDYAVSDVLTEGEHISRSSYPLATEHGQAHTAFCKRAEHYIRQLSDGENPIHLGHQIRHDLNLWISHHIIEEDKHCARFLLKPTADRKLSLKLGWLYG